jgi:hypothetical protein
VQAVFIESSTSKATCEIIRIVILKGFHGHIVAFF